MKFKDKIYDILKYLRRYSDIMSYMFGLKMPLISAVWYFKQGYIIYIFENYRIVI